MYLRFQLPPMHLANRDSVVKEMQNLMDVSGKNGMRIIQELDVKGACGWDPWETHIACIRAMHACVVERSTRVSAMNRVSPLHLSPCSHDIHICIALYLVTVNVQGEGVSVCLHCQLGHAETT